jgi:hypothetical protein
LGSKVTNSGAKTTLCSSQRHLAVIPAADPSGKIYSLTVPVSGMKALREYFKELNNYGLIPEEVVTEFGFDDEANFPKITFKRKGFVPQKAVAKVEAIASSDDVKVAVRSLPLSAYSGAAQLSAPAPAEKPKLEAVKPAVEEDVVDEVEVATASDETSELEKELEKMFE